jgi:hypothetical protein
MEVIDRRLVEADEQKLIEIGRATECAFMNFEEFGMAFPFEIGNISQLLKWYRGINKE